MSANKAQTLLVTGGSGHLGRQVIELLLDAHVPNLVTTTRTPEKLADLAARGVAVRRADFDDPASLVTAFAGVDRLLLISTDVTDHTGRRQAQQRNAVSGAVAAGVKHVVYTSFTSADQPMPFTFANDHADTEAALAASPLSWTILRNNLYTDYLLYKLPQALAGGQLRAAAAGGGVGYVTREDCARAAVAALLSTDSERRTLDITGPDVLTHAQLAQIAGEVAGRPLAYTSVAADALRNGMITAGVPEGKAAVFTTIDQTIAQGLFAVASNAVATLTGQAPQSVREFLTLHRAALIGA